MKNTIQSNVRTFATLLIVGCILLAGCSGWSDDGPADDIEDADDNIEETDDVVDETEDLSDSENGDKNDKRENTAGEYADPDDAHVIDVIHMERETGLNHDEIVLSNTNDEHPLQISGWEIETDRQDQRVSLEERTVIGPGETQIIQFEDSEKMFNEDGGVVDLYDADGNHVGSWDHVGSPSVPPENSSEDDIGYVLIKVIDAETNEEIEDATITLAAGDGQFTGTTDGAGVTTIQEVPYGEYELVVEQDQYTDHDETMTVDEEGTETTVEVSSNEARLS
jgi:hypothetical protein